MVSEALIMEVTKVIITGAMTYAKQKGLSDEKLEEVLQQAREEFTKNDPSKLQDV